VSLPPRAYRSAAEILAEAVERAGADATLFEVAREHGRAAGRGARPASELVEVLRAQGYEPVLDGDRVRLHNCPYHRLADRFPAVVCGMNLALLQGLLDGLDAGGWQAMIEPTGDNCCVVFSKDNDS
jgi:predicted ArsR family transcriptional regulator